MRIHVVADVHGNTDALARAGDGADLLLILGDLLDYVDYHDPSAGVLGSVFGEERVRPFVRLRTTGDFAGLHAYNQQLWSTVADPVQTVSSIVADRYRAIISSLSAPTLVMLGNVDVVAEWQAVAPPELQPLDGVVREIGGVRFGFVGGGSSRPGRSVPASPVSSAPTEPVARNGDASAASARPVRAGSPWQPFVRPAGEYLERMSSLGPAEVLCTHIPPKLAMMRYDTIPARLEMYGPGTLEYIDAHQPAMALSGHVHQPLSPRVRRGRTECVNVGHFQRTGRPFLLEL